ncbi:MAG TPA: nuclear transport factor 2 family protein [Pyrinomonadaceae bacterium]|nr:nuclear transport factor 2 family protein [Pyrinomonadaceae bacterium]
MNKRIFLGSAILIAGMLLQSGCATMPEATGAENDKSVAAVRAVLDAQVAAWNRGDIEEFMIGYERAETIVFVSGDNVTRGWQPVMDRYRKNYGSPEKMGTLAFSELEIKPLSPFYAMAVGRWQLTRAGDTPRGRFTLIFRRTAEGWRIVHDHTSSAQ